MELGTLRATKTLITFDPMVGFQRFKKANCSEFNQEYDATIIISLTTAKNPQRRFFPSSDGVTVG